MNLLIVTACPNGQVTSVLCSRLLQAAAERLGWQTRVEVHDARAIGSPLSEAQIAAADWVLVVKTGELPLARFAGKRLFQASPAEALADPQRFLRDAAERAQPYGESSEPVPSGRRRLVAVTACPTGVAHTFMAAEALQQAAQRMGIELQVETRGSVGARNLLDDAAIAAADAVLLATDIEVDTGRFAGKKVYRCGTGVALKHPQKTLERALSEARPLSEAAPAEGKAVASSGEKTGPYKHLLTGVSYMLPMVVAGGLLIALSFVFGIEAFKEEGTLAAALMKIGGESAFQLMVPLLAGYIAYSIADRPGLAPGMIGGLLASSLGAGFIGGIIAGFLAGYSAKAIAHWVRLPASVEALKPILIIPLVASLFTGLVMIYLVGSPVAGMLAGLTAFLDGMGSTNAILLGVLLGGMMCVDLGGPINKAAYAFSVGLLASSSYAPMAATMAAGMVPPIGMAIATVLARRKFAQSERQAGKAAGVLGLCFISEGAIPFAAKDPLRVIPASIAGGALTGALSMYFGCKLMAPHGGLFVLLIPNAINHALLYLLAIVAGSLVTGVLYALIKQSEAQPLAVGAQ
ncbi:fructose-specific PTS transporter subunit EIIC [Pseudomonas chengduensis]|uniref:protein-N(pi)-phosphohistidine--D-fructose phosphotransferase n=1 Tax=Ectopseudomonas chengduensis TaxID=489632 RepID=A0A1G6SE89_9GAMM|nr:fructose-specific PTS transporter subunit EIIC [Pseudomonas chengduensis]MBP3064276.1 PTS transporter subunit EIIC [Pseudomonas chengduensis]MDH0957927.1 fructose-specific PTS transporter subunit EIIC [Pseudomonas chengduensis]NNB76376.1 PTS transporter subunit EIIC [Pseudomonas chengduensis]WKC39738.1 fructose-specific PTS transporter subunit EIIC [Pseudomonas chengduensis]SDD14467.1 PTS system D-fructose-specific IIB component (F1P-forming), Frc family /PTS system D-fructose-specific IIC 